ncbi:hypothetical protein ACE6H2_026914 [Prunus campanulata]
MQTKALIAHPPHSCLLQIPTHSSRSKPSLFFSNPSLSFTSRVTHTLRLPKLRFSVPVRRRNGFATGCISENLDDRARNRSVEDGEDDASVSGEVVEVKKEDLENPSLWNQMKDIAMFTGPATGLWICGPLMSLIDTVVIGQGSSIELAALDTRIGMACTSCWLGYSECKVAFYSLLVYFATSMGTNTMAAHQAQMLLKSLVIIGAILGSVLGIIGTCVPWLFPNIFTPDQKIIQEMHKVLIPYFLALAVTPPTHSLEGTLLTRFFLSLRRLISPDGILFSEDMSRYKLEKLRAV